MAERDLDLTERPEAATLAAWQTLARKALGRASDEPLTSVTTDGIAVPLLGTKVDWPIADASGIPGAAPFTRGTRVQTNGRWDIRTIIANPDIAQANAEILDDLANGATSIWLRTEVVPLQTTADFARVLKDVPPGIPIALDAGPNAAELGRLLLKGIGDARNTSIFVNHDAFAVAAAHRQAPLLTESTALAIEFATRSPSSRAIGIDLRPYHNAGATPAHELGIALAVGVGYLRALTDGGLALMDAAAQIAFILVTDADFVVSIAKLRAFRRILARVLDASGAPEAMRYVHVSAVTSDLMMTRRDPHTNILRTSVAAFAAALGGADAITVQPFTARLGSASTEARRIARNTQSVLMEEAHLGRVIDPAGGAFVLERLTEDLATRSWSAFQNIERQGGIAKALAHGSIDAQIAEAWDRRRKTIALRLDFITGVSDFPLLDEPKPPPTESRLRFVPAGTMTPLPVHHLDEDFEALRGASDRYLTKTGERPKIYLVRIGNELDCAERTSFARALFESGGVATIEGPLNSKAETAAEDFLDSGVRIAALVSSDAQYAQKALAAALEVKQAGARYLYFIGAPSNLEVPLSEAGVDAFIGEDIDAIETLRRLHIILGVAE